MEGDVRYLAQSTCRRGAWPGEEARGLLGLPGDPADRGEGGLRLRKDHREAAEDDGRREEEEEEDEDLEEEEDGGEPARPLEKLARKAQTSSSICLKSSCRGGTQIYVTMETELRRQHLHACSANVRFKNNNLLLKPGCDSHKHGGKGSACALCDCARP